MKNPGKIFSFVLATGLVVSIGKGVLESQKTSDSICSDVAEILNGSGIQSAKVGFYEKGLVIRGNPLKPRGTHEEWLYPVVYNTKGTDISSFVPQEVLEDISDLPPPKSFELYKIMQTTQCLVGSGGVKVIENQNR